MISLQKLLGKDELFFQLLEASAEEGSSSVVMLKRVLTDRSVEITLEQFQTSRQKEQAIASQIHELLSRTLITTIEREDIERISAALYKISKVTEKFVERYILTGAQLHDLDFSRQLNLLEQATEAVQSMVKALRQHAGLAKVAQLNGRLHQIERDADKLMLALLRELYEGRFEPVQALVLKDLYEMLEKIIDRARDAGNVIYLTVLKYS